MKRTFKSLLAVLAFSAGLAMVGQINGGGYLNNNSPLKAKAAEGDTYSLVTDVSELKVNDIVIITNSSSSVALSTTQNSNNRKSIQISVNDNVISYVEGLQEITLEKGTVDNTFAFNVSNGFLFAVDSNSNYLRTQENIDENASWSISINSSNVATIKANGSKTKYFKYNKNNDLFSCYSSGQQDVKLYKKLDNIDNYVVKLDANGGYFADDSITKEVDCKPGNTINLDSYEPKRSNEGKTSYVFAGWYTSATPSETDTSISGEYKPEESITLYAKWTSVTKSLVELFADTETKANLKFGYTKTTVSTIIKEETIEPTMFGDNYVSNAINLDEYDFNQIDTYYSYEFNKNSSNTNPRLWNSNGSIDFRVYQNNTLKISSTKEKIINITFDATDTLISKCTTSNGNINSNTIDNINSNEVVLTFSKTFKFTSLIVNYNCSTSEISYSNFNNLQLQFAYNFDFTAVKDEVKSTGIYVTNDDEFDFATTGEYDDTEFTFDGMLADGKVGHKFVNSNMLSSYIAGININELTKEIASTTLYACAFVQTTDGKYYFANTPKKISILSLLTSYQEIYKNDEETLNLVNSLNDYVTSLN